MSTHAAGRVGPSVDPLVLTTSARASQTVLAIAIDIILVLALLLSGALLAGPAPAAGIPLLVAGVAVVVGTTLAAARTGRTLGGVAAGIRMVERASGSPSGSMLLPDILTGRLRAFDVRTGRDPVSPALAPFRFPETNASARPARHAAAPSLLLDSGQRVPLAGGIVIGRKPTTDAGSTWRTFEWADLSRTLSKSHARVEWDGRQVWITDVASTNGSAMHTAEGAVDLVPFERTPVPAGARLSLGDRELTVEWPA